ncbi:hypothetical protein CORC01_03593 [Colletotrichum orchidophilum]|uniref:Uncharacterized protein n=1 Tax=Colletotrichum orchidophilum TaxID=1209926 RepID=A0A1G4BIA1_9PEZI|nr:uncharacterized protein CORC01_03593 [Colletotrichum orchidophilum]OHF01026.1 hypothetical protein CORC01_03593 [Colletotrichum orchidophilum]
MLSRGLTCLTRRLIHPRCPPAPLPSAGFSSDSNCPPSPTASPPTPDPDIETPGPALVVGERHGHVCLFARLSELLFLESSDSHARQPSPDSSRRPYVRTGRVTTSSDPLLDQHFSMADAHVQTCISASQRRVQALFLTRHHLACESLQRNPMIPISQISDPHRPRSNGRIDIGRAGEKAKSPLTGPHT